MEIEYVKDCVYAHQTDEYINCTVKFKHLDFEVPFSASKNDVEEHGREIYARIKQGEFGPIGPYKPFVMSQEQKIVTVRDKRNDKLTELDAIVGNPLRWASFNPEKQAAFAAYRQALLDVPQQSGFPDNIIWPEMPV